MGRGLRAADIVKTMLVTMVEIRMSNEDSVTVHPSTTLPDKHQGTINVPQKLETCRLLLSLRISFSRRGTATTPSCNRPGSPPRFKFTPEALSAVLNKNKKAKIDIPVDKNREMDPRLICVCQNWYCCEPMAGDQQTVDSVYKIICRLSSLQFCTFYRGVDLLRQ